MWRSAAMSGKVWLPESSLTDCKNLPNAEKRKRAKIVRRTTPTVELPTRGRNDGEKIISVLPQNYSTIEKNSYKKNSASLDFDCGISGLKAAGHNPEFCGWETDVGPRNLQASSSTLKRCAAERSYLSTPADGYRSGLPSRTCSRAVGRRNNYEFNHISDTRAYIEDYRTHYSYTALNLPKKTRSETGDDMDKCVCRRIGEGGRRTSGRGVVHRGEQYLNELAGRLGVGRRDSAQRLHHHQLRPTPPSFTKRNRESANLLVSTQEEKSVLQETQAPFTSEEESSELASRVVSASQNRPHTTAGSLELPTIPSKSKKTLSTTSVGKYFIINSRLPYSLGLGEEESAVDVSSQGSSGDAGSDGVMEGAELQMKNKPIALNVRASSLVKASSRDQQPTPSDDSWRDRVLAQKAQALGLISRDWTHISLVKKAISDQTNTSKSQTKGEAISYRHTLNASSNRDYCLKKGEKKETTVSRPGVPCGSAGTSGRLKKLRSVYEPDCSKGGPSRHTPGRQKCETRRPATQCQKDRGSRPKYLSRPSTKLGKKVRPSLQCEESQYWNEVPNRDHPQMQTGTGTCLRVDSLMSSMDCRPPQSSMDYRPPQSSMDCRTPQNTKLYPKAPRNPFLHRIPHTSANFELSGNRYRHITLTHKLSSRRGNNDSH